MCDLIHQLERVLYIHPIQYCEITSSYTIVTKMKDMIFRVIEKGSSNINVKKKNKKTIQIRV